MLSFRYIQKGKLNKKETDSLYNLFVEEETLGKIQKGELKVFEKKYYRNLSVYGKRNKYSLSNIGVFNTVNFKDKINTFSFILVKDRKERVLGYLCFEDVSMQREGINTLYIVKHMYISNALNHMDVDYVLFYLLENLSEKNVIFSDCIYRATKEFDGYSKIFEPFGVKIKGCLKIVDGYTLPSFWINQTLRTKLNKLDAKEISKISLNWR